MSDKTIDVKGNFAVRVGNMWAQKDYSEIKLKEQPNQLDTFKNAYKLAEKTGGRIVMFKPQELTDDQLTELKLAASDGVSDDD